LLKTVILFNNPVILVTATAGNINKDMATKPLSGLANT
jgi:hypothetical protein